MSALSSTPCSCNELPSVLTEASPLLYAPCGAVTGSLSQAHALQKHLAQLPEPLDVEAVIVSPLSRALQTAVGAFGGTSDTEGTAQPLMVEQEEILVSTFQEHICMHGLQHMPHHACRITHASRSPGVQVLSHEWCADSRVGESQQVAQALRGLQYMQEKQFGHSAVTSAGTPPFVCWEVCPCS